MNKAVLLIATLIVSSICIAESASGPISHLRYHTSGHNNENAKKQVTFVIGGPLASPCETLYVAPENDIAISFLLTAKAQGKDITAYYYPTNIAPWSSNTCEVYAVDLP